jgi:type I restriction enzyme R subunit
MFEQTFKNIDDVLWKEAGCATELDYTEQTSWILFLKYLDDLEKANQQKAELQSKKYEYIIDAKHRWSAWAAPKKRDGSFDHDKALTGGDLIKYVDEKLFPYLKGFRTRAESANTIEYKIGEIFSEIENKFRSGYSLRDALELMDGLSFRSQDQKHELSHIYEAKLRNMGNAGRNGGEYPPGFFDFIVIDECHRGGANDESNWRDILDYFSPAVQLGLTATPKRRDNVDTYAYFGEPVYTYSLKQGINDGFLTPFKVKQIATTLDDYLYTPDDKVIEGEIEEGKRYREPQFNRTIEIEERERYRVKLFMEQIDQREKTIVFCATQGHALLVRDLINQMKTSSDPHYCERVTADDGERGEQWLRTFQDNEKIIPSILTTSQKLSTGVDARNIRNIVLMRPIGTMIEFKQIIGRGTRLFDGKDYFTIYDFVKAYEHFNDPEWDGEPLDPVKPLMREPSPKPGGMADERDDFDHEPEQKPKKIKIKLADGKERSIQSMMATTFWSPNGRPISAAQFVEKLFGELPQFFRNEDELRRIWSRPDTRKVLLASLAEKGFAGEQLAEISRMINAEKSDLFDVLAYIAYALAPITRSERVETHRADIFARYNGKLQSFLDFVLGQYVAQGVGELDQEKLGALLQLKYHTIDDAASQLGSVPLIRDTFLGFQQHLYAADK